MKYFDIDILEEKILSAGMANEEQILLPMTYDYFLYAFTTQDLPENTEISRNWLELARQKEKAIQQIVGQRSGVQFLIHLVRWLIIRKKHFYIRKSR